MNKVAVVTGASYGLGEAICFQLVGMDSKVYGISRTAPKINHSQFIWIKADLLDDKQMAEAIAQINESRINLLVNNAGTAFLKKTLDYTDQDFERVFSLNFKVHAKITRQLFPKLDGGLIINTSSLSDRYPDPGWGLYGSSKAALNLFFETMAEENKEVKIINLLPSFVETPLQHKLQDGSSFDWTLCMQPEEVAKAVGYIVDNEGQITSGARIIVEREGLDNDAYNPEKLWVYSVGSGKMRKVR